MTQEQALRRLMDELISSYCPDGEVTPALSHLPNGARIAAAILDARKVLREGEEAKLGKLICPVCDAVMLGVTDHNENVYCDCCSWSGEAHHCTNI